MPRKRVEIENELQRLSAKREAEADADIRAALAMRMDVLKQELQALGEPSVEAGPKEPSPVVDAGAETVAPPPREVTQADRDEAARLLRESNLERIRGNRQASTDLLKRAAEKAPDDFDVLVALGDDFMERRRPGDAKDAYHRALELRPKDPNAERKYGLAVLRATAGSGLSIEDQLRMGHDGLFLDPKEAMAGVKAANWFNVFVPGVGQIVLGQTGKGFGILALWLAAVIGIILLRTDVQEMVKFATGQPARPTMLVLFPIFLAFIAYAIAFTDLRGMSRVSRGPVERPKPPVDLPFE